jgi:hypothetical protein
MQVNSVTDSSAGAKVPVQTREAALNVWFEVPNLEMSTPALGTDLTVSPFRRGPAMCLFLTAPRSSPMFRTDTRIRHLAGAHHRQFSGSPVQPQAEAVRGIRQRP